MQLVQFVQKNDWWMGFELLIFGAAKSNSFTNSSLILLFHLEIIITLNRYQTLSNGSNFIN